jgi:hypothetical protein
LAKRLYGQMWGRTGHVRTNHYPNRIQFIDIEIKLDTEEAIERLKGIPGGAETAIRSAIRSGLAKAKTAIVASIKKSFTTPLSYIRKAIGTPRYSGIGAALTGRLEIKRSRLPIRIFPHRQLPDAGGAIFGTDPPLRVFGGGIPLNGALQYAPNLGCPSPGTRYFNRTAVIPLDVSQSQTSVPSRSMARTQ